MSQRAINLSTLFLNAIPKIGQVRIPCLVNNCGVPLASELDFLLPAVDLLPQGETQPLPID